MTRTQRPDLAAATILRLLAALLAIATAILAWPSPPAPGSPPGQSAAALGALLLLTPLLFAVRKRSGLAASPPAWFVAHALAALAGSVLILFHVAAGDWLTPAGILLLLLVLLVVHGGLLRALWAPAYGRLFARSGRAHGFAAPAALDKAALQALIDAKIALLGRLDAGADEALFSPALGHWLRHPWLSLRYQWLAEREAGMVGARAGAGRALAWSRRAHLALALLFYLGLGAHVVVMLFFAGYAADGGPIDWWYVTAWGSPQ